ncbi:hypothetical protein G9C85_02710 [Halorubellus sp. JP-L1]|uniref:hypothetical protein n=1 Tax=Halorubellus sp. JP-L1 TaxID=2715753 RepID=UPI00140CCB89|nr:hypothetical protein [Halorubellus sp. JP-L1]NHN40549.1 hypothetical protein [Halorubellus sp. JP-L1]
MWECSLRLVEDCRESGLFDAPHSVDGEDACGPCATEAKRRTKDAEADLPWRITG